MQAQPISGNGTMLTPAEYVRFQEGPQAQNAAIQKDMGDVFLDRRVFSLRPLVEPHVLIGSARTSYDVECGTTKRDRNAGTTHHFLESKQTYA